MISTGVSSSGAASRHKRISILSIVVEGSCLRNHGRLLKSQQSLFGPQPAPSHSGSCVENALHCRCRRSSYFQQNLVVVWQRRRNFYWSKDNYTRAYYLLHQGLIAAKVQMCWRGLLPYMRLIPST